VPPKTFLRNWFMVAGNIAQGRQGPA
jgi:hypothetical protein